jgi:hypothetical protein
MHHYKRAGKNAAALGLDSNFINLQPDALKNFIAPRRHGAKKNFLIIPNSARTRERLSIASSSWNQT